MLSADAKYNPQILIDFINETLVTGLKDALFNAYLLEDASYLLFAVLLIFLSVWSFTASLTLTIASLSSIGAALGLAYFTYTFIFNLKFFPFMNVLAVVIALGKLFFIFRILKKDHFGFRGWSR